MLCVLARYKNRKWVKIDVWEIAVLLAVACDVFGGVLFCAVLFPTRCLGKDLGLN